MQRSVNKSSRGFTMIEIMVVVVIVAILAAIAVPTYIRYVESARAADAKSTISAIYKNARLYWQDQGEWPAVEDLENEGYLEIDRATKRQWEFRIVSRDVIQATSLDEMPGGAGKTVQFNTETGKYAGYGTFGKEAIQ